MLNGDRRPLQGCCGIATLAAFRFAAGYLSNGIPLNWNARDPSRLASEGRQGAPKGGERGSRICSSVSLVATPRPPQGADRFMLTTILAYVIAAVGLATILAGGWSFVMLAIQDERDRPFRHYAVAIAMLAGGFPMVGLARALRLLLLIYAKV